MIRRIEADNGEILHLENSMCGIERVSRQYRDGEKWKRVRTESDLMTFLLKKPAERRVNRKWRQITTEEALKFYIRHEFPVELLQTLDRGKGGAK